MNDLRTNPRPAEAAPDRRRVVRVLSIDGGGLRGVVPAILLDALERELAGRPLHQCFDLIAGTSTGGLIALGLGCRVRGTAPLAPAAMLQVYLDNAARIFPRRPWSVMRAYVLPKYSAAGLESVLETLFGGATLDDAQVPLLIASYDLAGQVPYFFKSRGPAAAPGWRLADIGRATSAAPTYLPAYAVRGPDGEPHVFIDGGIYANNPAVAAYAEAVRLWPEAEEIRLLAVGTGNARNPLHAACATGWGALQWATRIAPVMMDGVSEADDYEARWLARRPHDRFWRLQPELSQAESAMDDARPATLRRLCQTARDYAVAHAVTIAEIAAALR